MPKYTITLHTVFVFDVEAETEEGAIAHVHDMDAVELEHAAYETGDWYDAEIDVERCKD